jgi:hypothetical protein
MSRLAALAPAIPPPFSPSGLSEDCHDLEGGALSPPIPERR